MSAVHRRRARALPALALAAALAAAAAPAHAATGCTTPPAPDGAEPPCNPALADSPWSAAHRGNYAQASSPFPGPAPGQRVVSQHTDIAGAAPIILDFSSPYPDGRRVAWMSTVGVPDIGSIVKLDVTTGQIIDRYTTLTDEGKVNPQVGSISGAYNLLDRDDHLIVGRKQALEIYGDAQPGVRTSPIVLLKRFTLPASALCRSSDALVGITMLPNGLVAFATANGVIGVVPREPAQMDAAHLRTTSINGARCSDGAVADAELENVSNSIAADERNRIYTVTDEAQYQHRIARNGAVVPAWRAAYDTGAGGGVRLGDGSGSTPTLMGTRKGRDRFVVITDGQKLMHLVLLWRDRIPKDWKPIAPGKDRRIACEIPVRFGDPSATESVDEQSVLVRGYGAVLVNNALKGAEQFGGLPQAARNAASALAGGDPTRAPHGLERIDWDPRTRTCRSVWANRTVSIPNGVPGMSAATGLIYGMGQRDGVWGLEGLDWQTGVSRLWAPRTASPFENSFYAATTVGPDGAVWTGTFGGVTNFKPVG